MRTPADIYSDRFALGHGLFPGADPRETLARQLEAPMPAIHNIPGWQEVLALKSSGLKGEARKEAARRIIPGVDAYYRPLFEFARDGGRPFLARVMLDEPNRAATSETNTEFTLAFWANTLLPNMLGTHGDWLVAVILGDVMYRRYLNASENIGPQSERGKGLPADENLARELHQILSVGPGVLEQTGTDMTEAALLLTGLRNEGFDPQFQQPGDRVIFGQTFTATPGSAAIIETYLRWLAMRPETAAHVTRQLALPILGGNLTPALHDHLQKVYLATDGNRRAVLTAMVLHDDAWRPERRAPVNTLVGYVAHHIEHDIAWEPEGVNVVSWKRHLGYEYERAPNPEGLPVADAALIGPAYLMHRKAWPGTAAQQNKSMSHERTLV